ncbi:inositol monophosphatase family protein [Catellatospora methionotrophica]|uniref:inositol monophosphatase family protein n=1 Tax=Catellatospora methionotrophica TaxID=121620 RepID=UPI0033CA0BB1
MGHTAFATGTVPSTTWQHPEVVDVLVRRDIGQLFRIVQRITGANQTQLGSAVGLSQAQVSEIMSGSRRVTSVDVLSRIVAAFEIPEPARSTLFLGARQPDPDLATRPQPSQEPGDLTRRFSDVVAVYPDRSAFLSAHSAHDLFDGAADVRAVGLSLNLLCHQYSDTGLRNLASRGARLRLLLVDPHGEAIRHRERKEGYPPLFLSQLNEINLGVLRRVRDALPHDARNSMQVALYDETVRFNIILIDERLCVVQPYLPQLRGGRGAHAADRTKPAPARPVRDVRRDLHRRLGRCPTAVTGYDELLPIACAAVDIARALFLSRAPGRITAKGDRDMASEVDFAIERELAAFLRERTPEIDFLGEEGGKQGESGGLTWILDPIDGTVNFIHGSPLCGISLALMNGRDPVLGVVDLPFLGLRYTATAGGGARCGDRELIVRSAAALPDAVVAVGDYAVGAGAEAKNRVRLAVTGHLASRVQRIRMHGSAAIDLVWLAEGRVDGVVIMSNQPWDMAAGVVIAREAGAKVVDHDGSRHDSESAATIAANEALCADLLQLVTAAMSGRDPDYGR